MTVYMLKLIGDPPWPGGPTGMEMVWFSIAVTPVILGLLYWRSKIAAKIKPGEMIVHNDQLFPAPLNLIEDNEEVEIKKQSPFIRGLAMVLIILIVTAHSINHELLHIFGGLY